MSSTTLLIRIQAGRETTESRAKYVHIASMYLLSYYCHVIFSIDVHLSYTYSLYISVDGMTELWKHVTPDNANLLIEEVLKHDFNTTPLLPLEVYNIKDNPQFRMPISFSDDTNIIYLRKDSIAVIARILVQYRYTIVYRYTLRKKIASNKVTDQTLLDWRASTSTHTTLDIERLNYYINKFAEKAIGYFPALDSVVHNPRRFDDGVLSGMSVLMGPPGIGKVSVRVLLMNIMITPLFSHSQTHFLPLLYYITILVCLVKLHFPDVCFYQHSCDCSEG